MSRLEQLPLLEIFFAASTRVPPRPFFSSPAERKNRVKATTLRSLYCTEFASPIIYLISLSTSTIPAKHHKTTFATCIPLHDKKILQLLDAQGGFILQRVQLHYRSNPICFFEIITSTYQYLKSSYEMLPCNREVNDHLKDLLSLAITQRQTFQFPSTIKNIIYF